MIVSNDNYVEICSQLEKDGYKNVIIWQEEKKEKYTTQGCCVNDIDRIENILSEIKDNLKGKWTCRDPLISKLADDIKIQRGKCLE